MKQPPFIDIGYVSRGQRATRLEDDLLAICTNAIGTTRHFFPGRTEKIAMTLLEADSQSLDPKLFVAAWDGYQDEDLENLRFKPDVRLSNSMSGTVIKQREPVLLPTINGTAAYYALDARIRSAMGAPVGYNNDIYGALCVESERPSRFTKKHMWDLEQIARTAGIALSLYRSSILNFRTGLYNSNFYERKIEVEIEKSASEGSPLGLLLIDIDYLKEFNTRHGHAEGSKMIRQVAQLVLGHIPHQYPVARYGGDEFAVIMPDAKKQECLDTAEDVRAAIERAQIEHGAVPRNARKHVTVSIGVAHSSDPPGAYSIQDTASFCLKAAKGDFLRRPNPDEDLDAFNRWRDTLVRNQVAGVVQYGTERDPANVIISPHNGTQMLWAPYRLK